MKIIGHRGWRGKYPENSLLGFEKLIQEGLLAVELDIVITKDSQILVSHEPWFDKRYCNALYNENFYRLNTNNIQNIDCGSKIDSRFPNQFKTKTVKPLFKDLVALWNRLEVKPLIAIEVKSNKRLYGSYQPFPKKFVQLLIDFEKTHLHGFDYFVQSFDPFFLKTYHNLKPKTRTGLLVEYKAEIETDLSNLGYTPDYYNPEHILLNDDSVKKIKSFGCDIYTWTVNQLRDYYRIKDYPLQGIITDYPKLF